MRTLLAGTRHAARIMHSAVLVGGELVLDSVARTIEHVQWLLGKTEQSRTSSEPYNERKPPMLTKDEQEAGLKQCDNCGQAYDPIARRWRCPWCGMKENCCEGAPQ